ncbi:hypothetical protein KIN20_015570 [Parelaphostrongylus tenuis]|uniref:Uncharacterized protein n=1 Tax=Parelaphostrongylus tenuis TaxID=148309 RepID=A0AAD5MXJ8_PARTN|nr:hypothetical protein KIN20_015570 [Parelaphostrongylus tenuis]
MDKKEVAFVTTAHGSSIDPATRKFEASMSCNKGKGYVDLTDQMVAHCSYIRRTNKWWNEATNMINPVHVPLVTEGWYYTINLPFVCGNDFKDDDQKDNLGVTGNVEQFMGALNEEERATFVRLAKRAHLDRSVMTENCFKKSCST